MADRTVTLALKQRARKLSSLLTLICRADGDSFESLSPTDRENVLWLASDLADEIDAEVNHPVKKKGRT